jgi:hypothetical protein
MADRRTFQMLSYSQLSGIKVKAVIRPKYNNLYIVMIQCTHYKNYYTFKASNDNTHKTKQYTQIQLNLQLVIKMLQLVIKIKIVLSSSHTSEYCKREVYRGLSSFIRTRTISHSVNPHHK